MAPTGSEGGRGGWRFWIDRGGTFTDLVGQAPDGSLVVRKVLSERGLAVAEGAPDGAAEVAPGQRSPAAPSPADRLGAAGEDGSRERPDSLNSAAPAAFGAAGNHHDLAASGDRHNLRGCFASGDLADSTDLWDATDPDDGRDPHPRTDPAVAAIREVLGLAAGQPLPDGLVEEVRLGTTVATNALLERRVEPVLLLVNRGFADLAAIGEQHRPDLFALRVERPPQLPYRVLEVPGRWAADGSELEPFHRDPELELQVRQARAEGLCSCAVALLHAVVDPAHELALGAWLEELGFGTVLLSHRVGGLPRLLPRLHTTLVEAAVRPVLQAYLAQLRQDLGAGTRLRVMTSAGVLQPPDQLLAKDTVLSGPAGGLAGAVAAARAAGLAERPILGFDMGGTSTDVFHLEAGAGIELSPETAVAGLRLQAPTLPIHTVAAGGGSVLRLEGGRLQVGPESAGAVPGPACYRRGGPLTITDANLLLGRLPEGALPPVFGPGGDQPPDTAIVRRGFEALATELVQGAAGSTATAASLDSLADLAGVGSDRAQGELQPPARPAGPGAKVCGVEPRTVPGAPSPFTPEALAQGARSIALERMAEAIRRISIQRGHDIRAAVLVSYGGAGGQHACALAERLGVERVLLHPLAGVLSAYGLGLSRQEALRNEAVQRVLEPALMSELRGRRDGLLAEASQALHEAGDLPGDPSAARISLELRPTGGERGLEVPWVDADTTSDLRTAFEARHRQRFGYVVEGETLLVERLQIVLPAGVGGPEGPGSGGAPTLWQECSGAEERTSASEAVAMVLGGEVRAGGIDRAGHPRAEPGNIAETDGWNISIPDNPVRGEIETQAARPILEGSRALAMDGHQGAGGSGFEPDPARWVPLCLPAIDVGESSADDLAWCQVPCWHREELQAGQRLVGPAVVLEATGTTVLEPGWGGQVLPDGALLLEPVAPGALTANRARVALQGSRPAHAQGAIRGSRSVAAQLGAPNAIAAVRPAETTRSVADPGPPHPDDHSGCERSQAQLSQTGLSTQFTRSGLRSQPNPSPLPTPLDPVRLELYNHRFSAIAEQMGVRLQQSSRSVNIRERLDFSCALFDGDGQLVANAPHIPVHLGSMGESVAALLAAISRGERPRLAPGDAVASNDPYSGGTHLPDITVISPVFAPQTAATPAPGGAGSSEAVGDAIAVGPTAMGSSRSGAIGPASLGGSARTMAAADWDPGRERLASTPLFYVACRGHHADVGGITPGSMPPFSRSILEEGLRLDNVLLIHGGRLDRGAWRERLAAGPYPVRDPERLLADLQAQVAANRLGEAELHRLMIQQGTADVVAAMGDVQRNAAEAVRSVIDRLSPGCHAVELDDGSRIVVAVDPDHRERRVRVDFSGTSPQQGGNLNAPLAITKAVVLYVFRVLVAKPIPLNAGCFEPIDLVVPPGCLLHPTFPAAVVGGNVETSQAVANALFGALGVLAAGQGTMNNLSFGNERCQYYETVAGGSGAGVLADGRGFAGCSAVQSHMTNSRLTDPEILEARFPVRLERFARRRGSGGIGRWRGGDGVVRMLRALEPITLAILSGSRRVAPFALAGGGEGLCGRNALLRADGGCQELGGSAQVAMEPGDLFVLETPGGGGWGVGPAPVESACDGGQGVERVRSGAELSTSTVVRRSASPQAGAQDGVDSPLPPACRC